MKRSISVWSKQHQKTFYNKDEYPECSIYDFLAECSAENLNYTALEFYGKKFTYKKLLGEIDAFANFLYHNGVKEGSAVTVVLPNVPQAIIAFYAVNKLGAVANIMHPLLSKEELVNAVKNTESVMVITLYALLPKFKDLFTMNGCPQFVLTDPSDGMGAVQKAVYRFKNRKKPIDAGSCRVFCWNKIKQPENRGYLPENTKFGFDDTAVILYSGGTVGKPKGIELTNGNFNALAVQLAETYYEDSMRGLHSLALMPVFHGFGLGVSFHGMLCNGAHVFPVPIYDMNYCADLIFKKKIGILYGVPALFEALSRSEKIEKQDLSFIKGIVVAGDSVPSRLIKRLNKQLKSGGSKTTMREAYGLTECTSGCCINPFFALKDGSIGLPFTDMDMTVTVSGTSKELPCGEIGEICICGPTVMKGYYKNPRETAKVIITHEDGKKWLHTGDMGYMDEDGYFFFVQRKSNMLISAGYNVYPSVIESAARECNLVSECCVIGVDDAVLGQKIILAVVPKTRNEVETKEQVMAVCREKLPQYSLPHSIICMDKLPKTNLGKVDKTALSEYYSNKKGKTE